MSPLICKFASPRSAPAKIQHWIRTLERLRQEHAHHPDTLASIERLLSQARRWIEEAAPDEPPGVRSPR